MYASPADPAAFIAAEAARMAAEGEAYRAKPINGVVDTEESAAAYWEDERVRALLEVRGAQGPRRIFCKRRCPHHLEPLECGRDGRSDRSPCLALRARAF